MKHKLVLLPVESSTEEIVYLNLLKKLYNMEKTNCKRLPETARRLIEPLLGMTVKRLKCLSSKTEQAKKLLGLMLKRYELPHALEEFEITLAVAADDDKNPLEGVKRLAIFLRYPTTAEWQAD